VGDIYSRNYENWLRVDNVIAMENGAVLYGQLGTHS